MARTRSAFIEFNKLKILGDQRTAESGLLYLAGFVLCDLVYRMLFTILALAVSLPGFWLS